MLEPREAVPKVALQPKVPWQSKVARQPPAMSEVRVLVEVQLGQQLLPVQLRVACGTPRTLQSTSEWLSEEAAEDEAASNVHETRGCRLPVE